MVLAVEAISEIIVDSYITDGCRNKIKRIAYNPDKPPDDTIFHNFIVFVDKLVSCGYCTSVWVSGFLSIWSPQLFENGLVNWVCFTFMIHRSSNWAHVLFQLVKKGRVFTCDIILKHVYSKEEK